MLSMKIISVWNWGGYVWQGSASESFGELAGELQYISEKFWNGCSEVVGKCGKIEAGCDLLRMRKEKNRERVRILQNAEKRLIQARTAWKSGRLGNGQILEWKPF